MPDKPKTAKEECADQGIDIRKATREEVAEAKEFDRVKKSGRKTFQISCPWK